MDKIFSEADAKQIALDFFFHWYNAKGNNTVQGFDDWWKANAEKYKAVSTESIARNAVR